MIVKTFTLMILSVFVFPLDGFCQVSERPDLDRLVEREDSLLVEERVNAWQEIEKADPHIPTALEYEQLFESLVWSISKNDKIGELLKCDTRDLRKIARIEKEFRNRIDGIDSSSLEGQVEYGKQLVAFRERVTDLLGAARTQRAGVIAVRLAYSESAPDFLCALAVMERLGPIDKQLSSKIRSSWAEYRQETLSQTESGLDEIKEIIPKRAEERFDEILSIALGGELEGVDSKSSIEFIRKKLIEALFFKNEFSANVELVNFQTVGLERLLLKMNQDEEFQMVHKMQLELEKNGSGNEIADMRELHLRREAISSRLLTSFVADIKNELVPHQCKFFEVASLYYFAKSREEIPFIWPVILKEQLQLDSRTVKLVQERAKMLKQELIKSQARLSKGYLHSIRSAASSELRQKLGYLEAVLEKDITRKDLIGKIPRLNSGAGKKSFSKN